jgi:hypothetical protein
MILKMRLLEELINRDDPGWPFVQEWIAGAVRPVEALPREPAAAERTLMALQVTTRSPMGAIVYETGGILVDHGWLRILGSGHPRLPRDLASWNGYPGHPSKHRIRGALLIADDVLGGFFAANGGAFGPGKPTVFYFSPDTLDWQDLKIGYSEFVSWAMTGRLDQFYEPFRWPGWEQEAATLTGDQVLSVYPFLSAESRPIAGRSRRAVPIEELWGLQMDIRSQLARQAGPK